MNRRLAPTTLDYPVMTVAPTLIICMVVSLMWFVVSVFGTPAPQLNWIVFFFAIAAVLITRIAIDLSAPLASSYALMLGAATLLVIGRLAPQLLLPAGFLLGACWWAVHQLTWDSTVIDESQRARTAGLLQTVGLERPAPPPGTTAAETSTTMAPTEPGRSEVQGGWRQWWEAQRRLHVPGRWALYFLIGSLPIFGLGQAVAVFQSPRHHGYRFLLVVVYLASNLALLMSTSLLQLRKYLRQRQVEMPDDMARSWLLGGTLVIAGTLVACQLLPRPQSEYSVTRLAARWLGAEDLEASRYAPPGSGVPADLSAEAGSASERDRPTSADDAAQKMSADSTDSPGSQSSESSELPANDERSGTSGSQSPQSQSHDSQVSQSNSSESNSLERHSAAPRESQSQSTESKSSKPDRSSPELEAPQPEASQPAAPQPTAPQLPVAGIVRGVYWLALLAGLAWTVWQLRDFLAHWWRSLRAGGSPSDAAPAADDTEQSRRPFADFTNPYRADGTSRLAPAELVSYSFAAVEAWAEELGRPRSAEQTPSEFARGVVGARRPLHEPLGRLAELYNELAYGSHQVPERAVNQLRPLWSTLLQQRRSANSPP